MQADRFQVAARAHPFKNGRTVCALPVGSTAWDAVKAVIPAQLRGHAQVFVNGVHIPQAFWQSVKPKPATFMTVTVVPQGGGGGKNPLSAVLSIALAFAAPGLGAALATSTGLATATAGGLISWNVLGISGLSIATGLVGIAGRLAISAIAPPATQKASSSGASPAESPTQFLAGSRNSLLPYGRVPRPLGRLRMVPPLGALPYTETVGDSQYLRMIFIWGYGPLQISDLCIGNTSLSEFKGVEIEHRQGYPDDAPLTLFSNTVLQNDLSVLLKQSEGWQLRTTEPDTEEISVDVTFARGLVTFDSSGQKTLRSVAFNVEFSPAGENLWANVDGYLPAAAQTLAGLSRPLPQGAQATERNYRIGVDAFSGLARIFPGNIRVIGEAGALDIPVMPDGFLPVARVYRASNSAAVIPVGAITDERLPGWVPAKVENINDFKVSVHAANDTVSIAAGGLPTMYTKSAKQTAAVRQSVHWRVPKGQYDVRLKRATPDTVDDKVIDEITWTCLRSIKSDYPVNMPGIAMTAMRILATDQLNGVVDRLNGIVHSILPDWNGAEWVAAATSNPAALYREVLQGQANARALNDNRLDLETLQKWHEECDAAGREFDLTIDFDVSVHDVLQMVASAGRASPTLVDGKWSVVRDLPQDVPVQLFTARNVRDFQERKIFTDYPHALRVQFKNRFKNWDDDEIIVYDDGYNAANASKFEVLRLTGITHPDHAWRAGRYHIATGRLRPSSYTFLTDIEHLACTRGDLVRLAHDVISVSLGSARVKALVTDGGDVIGLRLDSVFQLEESKDYVLRAKFNTGGQALYDLDTNAGETSLVYFAEPVALAESPGVGDLVVVGEAGVETIPAFIRAIEPGKDMSARITCLDYAPAIYSADTGAIPPHNSVVSVPIELRRPPAPVLSTIQSGTELKIQSGETSYLNAIVVNLLPPSFPLPLAPVVYIREVGESSYRPAEAFVTDQKITISDIQIGAYYDLRIIYRSPNGINSPELVISGHQVAGGTQRPANVENFSVNILGEAAYLSWSASSDTFLSHYRLRYVEDTSSISWENAVDLVARVGKPSTSVTVPALSGAYLIKAVSTNGLESADPAIVISTVQGLNGFNAVVEIQEDPDFAGDKTDVVKYVDGIHLAGSGEIAQGLYRFANDVDLGQVYTSKLTAALEAVGIDIANNFDLIGNIDLVENMDGTTGSSAWSVKLQLRFTSDDPAGAPVWSAWQDFIIGQYTARAFQFRLYLRSEQVGISPYVYTLRITVDMPDRTEGMEGLMSLDSDAPETAVTYPNGAFRALPALAITAQSLSTGDYYTITGQSVSGFKIAFFNAAGARVTRKFDYIAKGFGNGN